MVTIERENSVYQQTRKKSLTQKYFLRLESCEIWCLMRKKTKFNTTLYDCMQLGFDIYDDDCGLYAFDGDCYELFRSLFWPVIMDYHAIDIRNFTFTHDFGDFHLIPELSDEFNKQILSIYIRINRSIQDYPMLPKLTITQLLEIEQRLKDSVKQLDQDLQGEYRSLKDINEPDRSQLREKSIFLQEPNSGRLKNSMLYNGWPNGRGVFVNKYENVAILVNDEDHLSFVFQSNNGQIQQTYERLIRTIDIINQSFEFQEHQHLGYLNFSPTNIGTAMQIDVCMKLLHIERFNQLRELAKRLDIRMEHTKEGHVFRLSNIIRLGRSELHIIRLMWDGIQQILQQDIHES